MNTNTKKIKTKIINSELWYNETHLGFDLTEEIFSL